MASTFRATADIAQDMCDDHKSITGVTISPTQYDDANVIKYVVDAGAISGFYAEAQKTINNFFPQTADIDSLILMLSARGLEPQIQPQKANGQIQFTFTGVADIPQFTQVQRVSDGQLYQTLTDLSATGAGVGSVFVEAIAAGSAANLDTLNEPFTLVTAVPNVNTSAINTSLFLDGRDLETRDEMSARVIAHDQDTNSGGNATAYEEWAMAASPAVVTAKCLRLLRGADTVDVVITAGTTDITAAVNAGIPVIRQPSASLVAQVQAYIKTLNPVTDDVLVYGPTEIALNVTFNYSLVAESTANRTYTDGQIRNIIAIYLYSARSGDILTPSAIERLVDAQLGSTLTGRRCSNLGGASSSYTIPAGDVAKPGTTILGTLT